MREIRDLAVVVLGSITRVSVAACAGLLIVSVAAACLRTVCGSIVFANSAE